MSKRIQIGLHIGFWLFIVGFPLLVQALYAPEITKPWRIHSIYHTSFTMVSFYFSFFLLSPYILKNKALLTNIFFFLGGATLMMIMKVSGFHILNPMLDNFYDQTKLLKLPYVIGDGVNNTVIMGVAVLIRVTQNYYKEKAQKNEMLAQQQHTELALLKAQINPHFFFNTLNNIYSLVYKKSDDAPAALLKLSEIMRYMLYESKTDTVPLEKELLHLENYLELEKLRVTNPHFVSFKTKGDINGRMVPPLLLLSFVENAFKHGKRQVDGPGVIIRLRCGMDDLEFTVINYTLDSQQVNKQNEGIGLQNVMRRLELLYPDCHELEITHIKNQYKVSLLLTCEPQKIEDSEN